VNNDDDWIPEEEISGDGLEGFINDRCKRLYGLVQGDRPDWDQQTEEIKKAWRDSVNGIGGGNFYRAGVAGRRGSEYDLAVNRDLMALETARGHLPKMESTEIEWFDAPHDHRTTTEEVMTWTCLTGCPACREINLEVSETEVIGDVGNGLGIFGDTPYNLNLEAAEVNDRVRDMEARQSSLDARVSRLEFPESSQAPRRGIPIRPSDPYTMDHPDRSGAVVLDPFDQPEERPDNKPRRKIKKSPAKKRRK
jgi:hypothetical protein